MHFFPTLKCLWRDINQAHSVRWCHQNYSTHPSSVLNIPDWCSVANIHFINISLVFGIPVASSEIYLQNGKWARWIQEIWSANIFFWSTPTQAYAALAFKVETKDVLLMVKVGQNLVFSEMSAKQKFMRHCNDIYLKRFLVFVMLEKRNW